MPSFQSCQLVSRFAWRLAALEAKAVHAQRLRIEHLDLVRFNTVPARRKLLLLRRTNVLPVAAQLPTQRMLSGRLNCRQWHSANVLLQVVLSTIHYNVVPNFCWR